MIEDIIKKWLSYEPRRATPPRHKFYPLTVDILYPRLNIQLPSFLIKDKKILDLGCCIPFNEPWCMENGAVEYHGVEILRDVAQKGNELVSTGNKIFHDSIENFIDSADLERYDLIIAQSSLNAVANLPTVLEKLFSTKRTIVFEFTENTDHAPKALINISSNAVNYNETGDSIYEIQKWYPNLESLNVFCKINKYQIDNTPNETMKIEMPEWSKYKFCSWANPKESNKIYPLMKDYEWRFDKKVAKIFDDHAPRHIPDYDYIINSITSIIKNKIDVNDKILEIGCATGKTVKKLFYNGFKNITATDCSQDMLNACPLGLADYIKTDKVPKDRFKLILANWIIQFNQNKKDVIEDMIAALEQGGIAIISEKTTDTPKDLYYIWKKQQGVSEQEILEKEQSLKGVLFLNAPVWYEKLFKELNCDVEVFNNKLGFYTWIIHKK